MTKIQILWIDSPFAIRILESPLEWGLSKMKNCHFVPIAWYFTFAAILVYKYQQQKRENRQMIRQKEQILIGIKGRSFK